VARTRTKIKKILENVLQVRGFHAFLFMTKDSCFVQMAHSVAKFATINPIAEDMDRKIFAFIGDRLSDQEPQAILIPTNAWTMWTTHKVGMDVETMTEHYKDRRNYSKLYQEARAKTIKHIPNILAILLSTVRLFNMQKKRKMQHECLDLLMRQINNPDIVDDKDEWNLVWDWLITATYSNGKKKKKSSIVGINIEGVTYDDDKVQQWIGQHLDETMGPCRKPPPMVMPLPPMVHNTAFSPPHMPPQNTGLAADIGQAIGIALKTASTPSGVLPTGTKDINVVRPYTRDEYGLLMAFCNVVRAHDLPSIWRHFTASKVKQVEIHCRQLQKHMEEWGHNYRTEIDTIFFEQKTIEDIINLRFNPGEGIAQYCTCERGVSILVCRPSGIAETERLQDHEHATEATRGTHKLNEASNLTTAKPRLLASTFHDVQRNIGTFCAFVHVLFGSKCKYYSKLMDVKQKFDNSSTQTIQDAFNVNVCRHIIWAIVCDGHFFFGKVKLSQDLIPGVGWKDRPTSLLNLILDKVMFAKSIMRPTFPIKWEYTMEPPPTARQNEQRGGTPRFGDRAQPQGGGDQGKGKGGAYQHGNQYQQSGTGGNQYQQQGRGNLQPWTSPRDARHPKIKVLIDPLLAKDN
jgi:hypothetical protein